MTESSERGVFHYRPLRFVIAGIANTAFGYVLFLGLSWIGLARIPALVLTYLIGGTTAYVLHNGWTFRDRRGAVGAFIAVNVCGVLLNWLLLAGMQAWWEWPLALAQMGAIAVVTPLMYVLMNTRVFKDVLTPAPN